MYTSCIDCEDRFVEVDKITGEVSRCHTTCESFINSTEMNDNRKALRREILLSEYDYVAVAQESARRCGASLRGQR